VAENKAVEILKNAVLLEKRGRAYYSQVAGQSDKSAVRQFFQTMADEEKHHEQILADQFRYYQQSGKFKAVDYPENPLSGFDSTVLTGQLKEQISAADFEAAAIAAAMALEKNAVELYDRRFQDTDDPEEKALYRWLRDWEKTHLELLAKTERELTEGIWFDNSFWPF